MQEGWRPKGDHGLHGAPLHTPLDVTKTKGPKTVHGLTLTIAERNRRDDMITMRMYGLEMMCHTNGCRTSSQEKLER